MPEFDPRQTFFQIEILFKENFQIKCNKYHNEKRHIPL